MAQALAVPPSNFWSGIDGSWSTFVLQVGTDPVAVNVLISTSEPVEYIIVPEGCTNSKNDSCASARGGLYNPKVSSTWQEKGWYTTTAEATLGYSNKGEYGFDTVALGYQGSGGPSLGNQIVAGIATDDFYIGLFGLLPKPFNFTNHDNPYPSYLQTLKDADEIPSLSWAYTAGARYRVNGVYASLTLGGYDLSRFEPNSVTIPMDPDVTKYLSVGVQSIGIGGTPSDTGDVLDGGITMMLDSTLPYLWLPREACDKFEDAFGLKYDEDIELYTISDTVRSGLTSQDPPATVNFQIGRDSSGGDTVQITLPYQAFDLKASPPLAKNRSVNYFPLKRAANSSQYVLGRTFFQEAYVIADFERNNFSVSQARFETGARSSLTDISPPGIPTPIPKPKAKSHTGAIVGAVIGVLVALAIIGLIVWCCLRNRRRQQQAKDGETVSSTTRADSAMSDDHVPPYSPTAPDTIELDSNNKQLRQELEAVESPGTPNHGYYSRSPEMAKRQDLQNQQRSQSPLTELEARQVHELPGSVADPAIDTAATAKPLHLRTVSRDEIRSPSLPSAATDIPPVPPSPPTSHPGDNVSEIDLPGAFVQSPGRTFSRSRSGERVPMVVRTAHNDAPSRDVSPPASAMTPRRSDSGEISPIGSRTMSPVLEGRRRVSVDSVPIILGKPK